MRDVKSLEQRIVEAEIANLGTEINKGVDIIASALRKYLPVPADSAERPAIREELSGQINKMIWADLSYYAGYSLVAQTPTFKPEGLFLEAVRSYATARFLERVSEIETIAFEAHDMADDALHKAG